MHTCYVGASPEEKIEQLGARLHHHFEAGVLEGGAVREVEVLQMKQPPRGYRRDSGAPGGRVYREGRRLV